MPVPLPHGYNTTNQRTIQVQGIAHSDASSAPYKPLRAAPQAAQQNLPYMPHTNAPAQLSFCAGASLCLFHWYCIRCRVGTKPIHGWGHSDLPHPMLPAVQGPRVRKNDWRLLRPGFGKRFFNHPRRVLHHTDRQILDHAGGHSHISGQCFFRLYNVRAFLICPDTVHLYPVGRFPALCIYSFIEHCII